MTTTALQKLIHRFRMIGIAEGISFLLLLLIAMPLKYFLKIPEAVKIAGWMDAWSTFYRLPVFCC